MVDVADRSRERPEQRSPLPELSCVRLVAGVVDDDGVRRPGGSVGTIVHVYGDGRAYEVEFTAPVPGLLTVEADQVDPA